MNTAHERCGCVWPNGSKLCSDLVVFAITLIRDSRYVVYRLPLTPSIKCNYSYYADVFLMFDPPSAVSLMWIQAEFCPWRTFIPRPLLSCPLAIVLETRWQACFIYRSACVLPWQWNAVSNVCAAWLSLAICRPSGCTVASGVVGVGVVVVGVCNRSQMRTSKCPRLEMHKRNFW